MNTSEYREQLQAMLEDGLRLMLGLPVAAAPPCKRMRLAMALGVPMPMLRHEDYGAMDDVLDAHTPEPGAVDVYDAFGDTERSVDRHVDGATWTVRAGHDQWVDDGEVQRSCIDVTIRTRDRTVAHARVELDPAAFRGVHERCVARQAQHFEARTGTPFPAFPTPCSVFEDTAASLCPWPARPPVVAPARVTSFEAYPPVTHARLVDAIGPLVGTTLTLTV